MKKLLVIFAISLLGAVSGMYVYTKVAGGQTRIIEVEKPTNNNAVLTNAAASVGFAGVDLTYAAERSIDAVVHVMIKGTQSGGFSTGDPFFDFFFGGPRMQNQERKVEGSGSGVILTKDGFIVTNNHVIEHANDIEVVLNDKRSYKAVLVGSDPTTDIALLKIEASDLQYLTYGSSDNLKVGEWVLAIGNPFNLTSTVTAGIVSAKSRALQINGAQLSIESFIQTDAAVNPGNSGGALVNTNGDLVGINTAIASNTGAYAGYSFAVPVSIVQKVVADLMEFGQVQRGLLGVQIQEMNNELATASKIDKIKGVYVKDVNEGSGAQKAGLKSGDIIISVDGEAVNKTSELQERVSRHRPGDKVEVEIIRDGAKKTFSVTLQNQHGNTDIVKTSSRLQILGAGFEPVSDKEKQTLRIRNGLKVINLQGNGKFKEAGVKEGYIITKANRVPINSEDDLRKVVEVVEDGLFLTGIYPNGRVAYYAVNILE